MELDNKGSTVCLLAQCFITFITVGYGTFGMPEDSASASWFGPLPPFYYDLGDRTGVSMYTLIVFVSKSIMLLKSG